MLFTASILVALCTQAHARQCGKVDFKTIRYDVDQCKFDRFDYEEENDIAPAVADVLSDLAINLAGNIPIIGGYVSTAMDLGKGIYDVVNDQTSDNPLVDAIREHTIKNNNQMVNCMDQKIASAVTRIGQKIDSEISYAISQNVEDIMEKAGEYYQVAALYEVAQDLSNADGKLDRLHDAWMQFKTTANTKFDNVATDSQYYKNLLLPLRDFVKAFELVSIDYLVYLHELDTAGNYKYHFDWTVDAVDNLISWVKWAKYMIVYKEMRPRLHGRGCRPIDGVTEWEKQFDADHVEPLLEFMGDLHHLNRILDVTMPGDRTCTIDVLSTNHVDANGGKYFNFDKTALDAILGRTTWHNAKLKVGNDKTVIVWRKPYGKGDAFGRYDVSDDPKDGDWAVGDKITFVDCQKRLGLWRKGKAGATCDQTCNAIGHICDSDIQTTVQSCADIALAAREAGVTCAHHSSCYGRTDRDISYAGAPFISAQSGLCYYLSGGARSVCDSNALSHHEPLCYCAPKKIGLWRKGKAGATCDQTCNAIGRQCDSEMQSTIRSCEDIAAAASKAGVSCAHHSSCYGRTDRDISYAGAPFISAQSGLCYFLSDGAQSVCNSNAVGHHEPLCYCL